MSIRRNSHLLRFALPALLASIAALQASAASITFYPPTNPLLVYYVYGTLIRADVTGNNPTGTVSFSRNSVPIAGCESVELVAGSASCNFYPPPGPGTSTYTMVYSGDASNGAASLQVSRRISNQFAVPDVNDVVPGAVVTSATILPFCSGVCPPYDSFNPPTAAVSVQGGEWLSLGSFLGTEPPCPATGYSSQPGMVIAGSGPHQPNAFLPLKICVRHTAVLAFNAQTTTNLTIGSFTNAFVSTTMASPPSGDFDNDGIPNAVEIAEGRNGAVKDNDIFGVTRLFVMQQYRDFLGREGDADGLAYWIGQTNALGQVNMIDSAFNSLEFQGIGAPVARLYFAFFLRVPDYAGLNFQMNALRTGTSLGAIANNFSLSPEFQATYGSLSDPQYVALLYQNVLGRTAAQAEVDYHVNRLNAGATRGEVMTGFSESPEYVARMVSEIYVTMMYAGMLRRAPDQEGFDFWVDWVDHNPFLYFIVALVASQEYHDRFLP